MKGPRCCVAALAVRAPALLKECRDSRRQVCRRTASGGAGGMLCGSLLGGPLVIGKIVLFLGFVIGAAIFSIALIGAPASGSAASEMPKGATAASADCHVEEFALDEGYGITRKMTRNICGGVE